MAKVTFNWKKCCVEMSVKEELVDNLKKAFMDFNRCYKSEDKFRAFINYFKSILGEEDAKDFNKNVKLMSMVPLA